MRCTKIGNTCSCAVFQQQIRSHCHLLRNQSQSCILQIFRRNVRSWRYFISEIKIIDEFEKGPTINKTVWKPGHWKPIAERFCDPDILTSTSRISINGSFLAWQTLCCLLAWCWIVLVCLLCGSFWMVLSSCSLSVHSSSSEFFHQVNLYKQALLTANGLFWLKTLFWLFGLCSFQVLACLAWREYSRDWRASMRVFLWRVARRVKDATLTRQIDNSRTKLARVCEFFPCELCSFQLWPARTN